MARNPNIPKMTETEQKLFNAWNEARPTFPEPERSWGFDKWCREHGIIGPGRRRVLESRERQVSEAVANNPTLARLYGVEPRPADE